MKKILIAFGLLVLIGGGVAFYLYNKPHQNIERAEADFEMPASELFAAFEQNEQAAQDKYLDKIIKVTGAVQEVKKSDDGSTQIILEGDGMFGVSCQLDDKVEHSHTDLETGEKATLKGICTGKLMDVVLVRCVVVD